MMSWNLLPDLVLLRIFAYLPHPQAFNLVNKSIYLLSQQIGLKATWFIYQYGTKYCLSRNAFHSIPGSIILTLNPNVITTLLRYGADISVDKYFILEYIAAHGQYILLDTLLSGTYGKPTQDALNRVLMVGVDINNLTIVQLALHYGANINTYRSYPLRYACYRQQINLVRFLLQHGAQPSLHALQLTTTLLRQCLIYNRTDSSCLSKIDKLNDISYNNISLPQLIQRTIETIRWLGWYGCDERIALRMISTIESLYNYPLDAIGSRWFTEQLPRAVVHPPPNLLMHISNTTVNNNNLIPPPVPNFPIILTTTIETNDNVDDTFQFMETSDHISSPLLASAAEGEDDSYTEEHDDITTLSMTSKLGTIYPFSPVRDRPAPIQCG